VRPPAPGSDVLAIEAPAVAGVQNRGLGLEVYEIYEEGADSASPPLRLG